MTFLYQALNTLFNGGGIVASYTIFSLLQEDITKTQYGAKKEKFTFMQELVFVQCLAYCLVALVFKPRGKDVKGVFPWYQYALAAVSYTSAMVATNSALKFVPYPTQVLCKSCKPLPVLIFGVLFAGAKYHWRKYMYVSLIVLGMAIFMYKPQHSGKFDLLNFGAGEALLLLSLALDGVTGMIQTRMRNKDAKPEKWTMMFYMNFFSGILLSGSIMAFHDLGRFMEFVHKYPIVVQKIAFLSITGAIGQVFIFKTVSDFGPLTLSIITTSRKLISVFLSVIIFSNPFNRYQFIGTIVVFGAIFADAYESSRRHSSASTPAAKAPVAVKEGKPKQSAEESSNESDFDRISQSGAPSVESSPKPSPAVARRRARKV